VKAATALLAFVMLAGVSLGAQDAVAVGSRVGTAPSSGYDDGGRRDPFVSPMVSRRTAQVPGRPFGAGLAGVSITDVVVTGITRAGRKSTAILQTPDGKSYMVSSQDKLADGAVKSIEADAVVFVEMSSDAAGATRPHEVRKPIRVTTGVGR
jgi:hypothetical protein